MTTYLTPTEYSKGKRLAAMDAQAAEQRNAKPGDIITIAGTEYIKQANGSLKRRYPKAKRGKK